MRFSVRIIFIFILFSLCGFAGCKSSPEADIIGYWKSTNTQTELVVEIGENYFVSYHAPTTFGRADKAGETTKVNYESVKDEIHGLRPSGDPAIAIKNINGDTAHIEIPMFSFSNTNFVRVSPDEAKAIINSWLDKAEIPEPRALP